MRSEIKDEKRREIVYLIRCQPEIKLRMPFKELNYEFLDFLGGLVQWLRLCVVDRKSVV